MNDFKFAFLSKYTILGIILFAVLFSLRGSCSNEGFCQGGFPIKWLFKDSGDTYARWDALMGNIIIYYFLSSFLLLGMRKYSLYKENK